MDVTLQKRLASTIAKCSPKRVKIDPSKHAEVKEAITRFDIKKLIKTGVIIIEPKSGISNFAFKITRKQKRKGRQKGAGSRKGKYGARHDLKHAWICAVRAQRELLKKLKSKKLVSNEDYQMLYKKSKGGFFRSTRHIKMYLEEQKLVKKNG